MRGGAEGEHKNNACKARAWALHLFSLSAAARTFGKAVHCPQKGQLLARGLNEVHREPHWARLRGRS